MIQQSLTRMIPFAKKLAYELTLFYSTGIFCGKKAC